MNDQQTVLIEWHKARIEYLKHLATLSTGSIVLIVTFLEKLFLQPRWKFLVVASLVGFLLSVISSVISYSIFVLNFPGLGDQTSKLDAQISDFMGNLNIVALFVIWLGFLIGVICLTIFAIRNLI